MEKLFVQSSFAFLVRILAAVGRHICKRGPKRGSHVTFDKMSETNKNQQSRKIVMIPI